MTTTKRISRLSCLVGGLVAVLTPGIAAAAAPSAAQALKFRPVQGGVEFDRPDADQAAKSTVKPEKVKGQIAWVVRDASGNVLRRFTDTNGDKVVDQWSYFQNGFEIYRDIDANFNGKADQFRWCHSAGTRWGIDRNEDGKIDYWKILSPEEAAEELVNALRTKDSARFARLVLTEKELKSLGLNPTRQEQIQKKLKGAAAQFRTVASGQKAISSKSTFADFSSSRPGTIPAGAAGSTKDVTVYENAVAFVGTDGQHAQVALGTMIRVGSAWKLIDAPSIGNADQANAAGQFFLLAARSSRPSEQSARPADAPSEAETKLLGELEKVDAQVEMATGKKRVALNNRRADILEKLAETTKEPTRRAQWLAQLADTISAEVQSGTYPQGVKRLGSLQKRLEKEKGQENLVAHIVYRRLSAEYGLSLQKPKADYAKIQKAWLANLVAFAKKFPNSPDAADALLQLGMAEEFAGEDEKAQGWYSQAVKRFPKSASAAKATGAVRRLTSIGKTIDLRGPAAGGGTVDLAEYRGKVVLVQYWSTWCEPCKVDMARLKELYAKYGGRGFAIVGVSLDHSAKDLDAYLRENRVPWKHVFEEGGLDSRPANEMGILTLPTMILIDKQGRVLHRNIHVAELAGELKKVLD